MDYFTKTRYLDSYEWVPVLEDWREPYKMNILNYMAVIAVHLPVVSPVTVCC